MFDFFKKLFSNQIEENQTAETDTGTPIVVENLGGSESEKKPEQNPEATRVTSTGRQRMVEPVKRTAA